MSRSSVSIMNGLTLESVLDFFFFLKHGSFRVFLLKFINENTHLCVFYRESLHGYRICYVAGC